MLDHCGYCGSRKCVHDCCPECNPCRQCNGGDKEDKFFGYEDNYEGKSAKEGQ
jgi:hypothetical protein